MLHDEQHQSNALVSNEINSSMNTDEEQSEQKNDDEFIRITAAHQMLIEAQTYDQQNNYPLALQVYRICVDFLLEELMFAQGTDQSRLYLRDKCSVIMDRIDFLKTKLEPMPLSIATDQSLTTLPIDQLDALHLSSNNISSVSTSK